MDTDEQHAVDWNHGKKYNEDMFNVTGDHMYKVRIASCDRLLATVK